MAVFISDCPHCGAEQMTFPIFGARWIGGGAHPLRATVGAECGRCHLPVAAQLTYTRNSRTDPTGANDLSMLNRSDSKLEALHFELLEVWPKKGSLSAPADMPAAVERSFLQAERNYAMADCEEAAATMYRRALDLGIKLAFPDVNGTLDKKIKKLAETHELPASIAVWAHEVRLIGNDGAHDVEGTTTHPERLLQ